MSTTSEKESLERRLDIMRVEQSYERLNHLWAINGPATIGTVYQYAGPRANVMGLDDAEVDRVVRRIETFFAWGTRHDWIQEWTRAGDEYAERAEAAMKAGRKVTAGETWRMASACYFFGWYIHHHFVPIPARDRAQALCIEAYRKAAPLLDPPSERVDIPFNGRMLPGYLRRPDGGRSDRRWPVTIIVGGANSTKEENHPMTTQFLLRGMATLVYDGPGQNEYLLNGGEPMRLPVYNKSLATVVDWLAADGRTDPNRVGLFARSGGAIPAVHAVAAEPRIKALVIHPANYETGPRIEQSVDILTAPMEVAHWLGANTLDEFKELARDVTVKPVIADVRCPMLLINGKHAARDAERMKAEAKVSVDISLYDMKGHGGPPSLSWPEAADWMAGKLGTD